MQIEHVKASADGLPERYRVSGGRLEAEVVPGAGMCLASLEIDGRPQIAMPLPLAEFMGTLKTGGVPLLYPWANRLAGDVYAFDGREVDLANVPDLKRDGSGLPMHGLLLRYPGWTIETRIDGDEAVVEGRIDWESDDWLMSAFPFPHELIVSWTFRADESGAEVKSTLTVDASEGPVPVASGWHPYLAPPVASRESMGIEGPALQRIRTGADGLPECDDDGELRTLPPDELAGPLGSRSYDNLFVAPPRGFHYTLQGEQDRISIAGGLEWRNLQVYAPTGSRFACIEPMFAPTAALSRGRGLLVAHPGTPFRGSFMITVD